MAQIKVGKIVANYETARAEPAGRCVVMLHGAGQSAVCWENQLSALAGYTRFPSLALDLPGHGKSGGEAMTSMDDYAAFVEEFCTAAGILEPVLIGHSMGGRIAQILIPAGKVKSPGCMLVATGTRIRVSRWSLKTVMSDYENFCATAAQNAFPPAASSRVRNVFLKRLLATPKETSHSDLLACDGFDATASARAIDIPAVIVAGEKDMLTPAKHTDGLHASIKGSKLFTVEGAGHFMMMETPAAFNKIMLDFLNLL